MGLTRQKGFFRLMAVSKEQETETFRRRITSGSKVESMNRMSRFSVGGSLRVR
jgi:hypothetical protein